MKNSLIIMQINKGNSEFDNRVDQIKYLISQYNPDLIIINELNNTKGDIISKSQFPNYSMQTDGLDITDAGSITGILIHKNIHFMRWNDLETQGLSTVWIQLKYPGRKPVLVQGLYRQFCRINELNITKGDIISKSQFPNYSMQTDGMDITDAGSKTGILIHKNIHFMRWNDLESQGLSTVWIQLKYLGRRPVLVQGLYRQFRCINHPGSQTITKQKKRWTRIINNWEKVSQEDIKIVTDGDFNLNQFLWEKKLYW